MSLALPPEFEAFVKGAPCTVLARMIGEWLLDDATLNQLFEERADRQYQRELTLSNLTNVMLDVCCGVRRSVRAAYLARVDEMAASLAAFYYKLANTEPAIGEAIVEHTAILAGQLIRALDGAEEEPIPGFRTYIVDGNMLAGTEHRLKPLRKTRAAALPGKSLALFECSTGLVVQTVLWEDAHSQERALLPRLKVPQGCHLIADRNFCVAWHLCQLDDGGSYFTIRQHRGTMPLESLETIGKRRCVGRCPTGMAYEQQVCIEHDGKRYFWRMLTLKLDEPTRDGETEIVVFTNLPARVAGKKILMGYRQRWKIEGHFQRLTQWLHCEVETLSQPRAALFVFAMSLVAGNLLAVIIAAIRAVHGAELAQNLSYCELADEVGGAYRGMMLALPPERWEWVRDLSARSMATVVRQVAKHIHPKRMRKTVRKSAARRRTPNCTNVRHVSTYRVLQGQRGQAP